MARRVFGSMCDDSHNKASHRELYLSSAGDAAAGINEAGATSSAV